jgi:ribosome-associated protein
MQRNETKVLLNAISTALQEKKGDDLLILDFTTFENAVTEYFVICSATSKIHAHTLAAFVGEFVRLNLHEKPWQIEGLENSEWIIIDFVDVVVHIFQKETREFYRLEQLWADAECVKM